MERGVNEVGEVFRRGFGNYKSGKSLSFRVYKVAKDIMECRTSKLGGHKLTCHECGDVQISYNSCKNRHCPKCQFSKREQWILDRDRDLLPVSYFHVIFTVPHELNKLHLSHGGQMYDLLFKSAWKAFNIVVKQRYNKDVIPAMIAVLHSWGQNLSLHPHLHCIIPSGVFDKKHGKWLTHPNARLLCSIEKLTAQFKEVYLKMFEDLQNTHHVVHHDYQYVTLLNELKSKVFNVNIQPPFQKPDHVIQYLGRYSHRVAITNSRIVALTDSHVSFSYQDYRDNKEKVMSLSLEDFIDRFLQHILPDHFMKIRHFGFLSNKVKNQVLEIILECLQATRNPKQVFDILSYFIERFDIHLNVCQQCLKDKLASSEIVPKARSDPNHFIPI